MARTTLPVEFEVDTAAELGGMPKGTWFWTVPWAMSVDEDGKGFLNAHYPAETKAGGTVSMRVKRTGEREWVVDLSEVRNFRWDRQKKSGGSWWACPVVEMIGGAR
jgi:hypothetical protein